MTYDQYWNDDCRLTEYYRKADELKSDRRNQEIWLQGMYIYEALCDVSPVLHAFAKAGTKPRPYPEKPYSITKREVKADQEARAKANRKKAMAVFAAWAETVKIDKEKDGETSGDNR